MLDEYLLTGKYKHWRREEEFSDETNASVQIPYKDNAGVAFSSKKLSLEN